MTQPQHPPTRTENVIETQAGISFPDPYRWLEGETPEVRQWQAAQAQLATETAQAWPHYNALKERITQFSVDRIAAVPQFAGGQWFRSGAGGVLVSDTMYGEGRVVYDPVADNPGHTPVISWVSPSPDGGWLAVGVCTDGSENNATRLIEVKTGDVLANAPPQTLMDGWVGGAYWLPDCSGFYFLALEGEKQAFRRRMLFHSMVDGKQTPADIPLPDPETQDYLMVTASRSGDYLVASQGLSTARPIAWRDLTQPNSPWQPYISELDGNVVGVVIDDHYIAVTDVNAPRGRVVSIPLRSATPNDPATWTELVPESEAVIRTITAVGQQLYLTEFDDTYSRLRVIDHSGKAVTEVALPGRGALAGPSWALAHMLPKGHPDEYLFIFSSFVESWGVYRHRPGDDEIECLRAPAMTLPDAVVDDCWAVSEDGTRIPYHCVRLASTDVSQAQPTLLYAYGGYNVPKMPEYSSSIAAFITSGGVYVHGHIRGGAEYGRDWWEGGRMKHKQNGYKDLYAIAEDLIAQGRTRADLLAVMGGSNGGLMAGVALTQRPDLWRAVVPRVPVLDLMGACRHPYGRYAIEIEYGDPTNPQDIQAMAEYSAYQLVKDGTHYPSVFIEAGDTDPRCASWHARKFAARLQAATASGNPVRMHIWDNIGHGHATPKPVLLEQTTEWMAFVMQELGMAYR